MYMASEALSENCEEDAVLATASLKSVFLDVEVDEMKPVGGHTHGVSAAVRSTASNLIDCVTKAAGLNPVYYQGSSADVRKGRQISRSYFWAKDFMAPAMPPVADADVVAMVDVDYYVDMERKLVRDFVPHLLYTFQPSTVCKDSGDYKFTFLEDGTVEYVVSGGGRYVHKVWNWDGDSVSVEKPGLFGLPKKLATYAIERRRMDDDHQVVLLAPLRSYKGYVMCYIARKFAKAKRLDRLLVTDNGFLRMTVNTDEGLRVVTGKAGCYTQASVPARVDDAIASTARTLTSGLTIATVKSKMEDNNPSSNTIHVGAEILLEYHKQKAPVRGPTVSTLTKSVRRFQWVTPGKQMDDDAKPSMTSFMDPILDGGFVPDNCRGNDERGVTKRVIELKTGDLPMSTFVLNEMDNFLDILFEGKRHFLEPVDNEEVYARQDRPTQRRILDNAQHESATNVTKQFVKKEAYPDVNDPRIISTINGVDKMAYSAYIYAFVELIKKAPWYAFSKSPREIAERVAEICSNVEWVDATDFSRMDGRIGNVARELERRAMRRGFKTQFHPMLNDLMSKQYALRGITTHGVRYQTGLGRASGSAETSAFNTLLNAFVCYLGYRGTKVSGMFIQPRMAYKLLGLYGGDDGLSGGLGMKATEKAAQLVGQKLELVRYNRGAAGVNFLARRYGPDVWFGDSNSCCDIRRQIAKFHLTVHLPSNITPVVKLQEKSYSFSLTDANTPIIGDFVKRVLTLHPYADSKFRNLLGVWNLEKDQAKQYPNIAADWMMDVVKNDVPEFDMEMFRRWLDGTTADNILHPPSFCPRVEPKPKPGKVVIDGDLVGSEPAGKPLEEPSSIPARKRFRSRKPKADRPSRKLNSAPRK